MEKLVIVGSGGLAREIKWLVDECNRIEKRWDVLGWISNEKEGTIIAGIPVLGDDEWLLNYQDDINVVIAIGNGLLRRKIAKKYRCNPNISFPNIIAPSACLSDTVNYGCGCIIMSLSSFTVNISIGDFVVCNPGCTVGHDCKIEDFVSINPGANISGNITLKEGTTVGTGACIIQGLTIGNDAIVGAGSTVIRNVPDGCTVVGVPAKPLEKKG